MNSPVDSPVDSPVNSPLTGVATTPQSALEHPVLACFTAYEHALCDGNVTAMDSWFADDVRAVRFGIARAARPTPVDGAHLVGAVGPCGAPVHRMVLG